MWVSYRIRCRTRVKAPQLRKLVFYMYGVPGIELVIPNSAFNIVTPTLRHFVVQHCTVDWERLKRLKGRHDLGFKNLLTLKLSDLYPPPPNETLHSILSSSWHLEALLLKQAFSFDFSPSITWPCSSLRSCHLEGDLAFIAPLLHKVASLPTNVDLSFTFKPVIGESMINPAQTSVLRASYALFMKIVNRTPSKISTMIEGKVPGISNPTQSFCRLLRTIVEPDHPRWTSISISPYPSCLIHGTRRSSYKRRPAKGDEE